MAEVGDVWHSPCGRATVYCGDYRRIPRPETGAVLFDPPYSDVTHAGHNKGEEQVRSATGQQTMQRIDYAHWTPDDVADFYAWAGGINGWIFGMTDDVLAPVWRECARVCGRYDFAPVTIIQKRPRLVGDGPASWTVYGMASRPRTTEFSRWGCLPGSYPSTTVSVEGISGAKPLPLMRQIVEDYTREGDTIYDPTCGSGTTLAAALACGRRAIGAEIDPERFEITIGRLGWQPVRGKQGVLF